jgi:hypothetical protein
MRESLLPNDCASASRRCHTVGQPVIALGFRRPHRENERQNDPAGPSNHAVYQSRRTGFGFGNGRSSLRRTARARNQQNCREWRKKAARSVRHGHPTGYQHQTASGLDFADQARTCSDWKTICSVWSLRAITSFIVAGLARRMAEVVDANRPVRVGSLVDQVSVD